MALDFHRNLKSEVSLGDLKRIHDRTLGLSPRSRPFGGDPIYIDSPKAWSGVAALKEIVTLHAPQKISASNFHHDCVRLIELRRRIEGAKLSLRRGFKQPGSKDAGASLYIDEKCSFFYRLKARSSGQELKSTLDFLSEPLARAGIPLQAEWIGANRLTLASNWSLESNFSSEPASLQNFRLTIPFDDMASLQIFETFLAVVGSFTEESASFSFDSETGNKANREALELAMQGATEITVSALVESLDAMDSVRKSLSPKAKVEFRLVTFVFPDDDSNWGEIWAIGSLKGYKLQVNSNLPLKEPMLSALGLND